MLVIDDLSLRVAGRLLLDGAAARIPDGARVGLVGRHAQEAPGGPERLIDVVLAADAERTRLLAEAETARDPHRIAEIQTRLADIGAHAAPARAAPILAALGFDAQRQD